MIMCDTRVVCHFKIKSSLDPVRNMSRDRKWRYRKSRHSCVRKRPWPDPEVMACAFAIGTFCTTTIVVVQNLSLRITDRATGSHVTPKGVPLGVRMRSRKLHNIRA